MNRDPREVMGALVEQEASLIQACVDEDLLVDAQAILEAEQQRSRLSDRLEAALGMHVRVDLAGEQVRGIVSEVGPEVVILDSAESRSAVSLAHVLSVDGLPRALRSESHAVRGIPLTWSAVLRALATGLPVRIDLADGSCLRGAIEAVGSDHVDMRAAEGRVRTVMITAIRSVISSR